MALAGGWVSMEKGGIRGSRRRFRDTMLPYSLTPLLQRLTARLSYLARVQRPPSSLPSLVPGTEPGPASRLPHAGVRCVCNIAILRKPCLGTVHPR